MRPLIKYFTMPKESFSQFSIIMIGTVLSQAIPTLISPILTRLYSPDEFGTFSLFLSITFILSIIATGRYELAIILPEKDEEAVHLVVIATILNLIFCLTLFILLFLFGESIFLMLHQEMMIPWLAYLPLSIFLLGIFVTLTYWYNRNEYYKALAKNRVYQSSFIGLLQISLFNIHFSAFGLIIGRIVGILLANLFIMKEFFKESWSIVKNINISAMKKTALRYIDFPKYSVLSNTFNKSASQMPIILLATFFNPAVAGYFAISQRVLQLPLTIIGSAIGDIFRQKAVQIRAQSGDCSQFYRKTLILLFLISIIPFAVLYMFAPSLFAIVFGNDWLTAGIYARSLIVMTFFQFIANPLSNMFIVAEKQKLDLIWQTLLTISTLGTLTIGSMLFESPELVIFLFSLTYASMYIINILMSYKISKIHQSQKSVANDF